MVAAVQIHTKVAEKAQAEILTDGALAFLAALHRTFEATRQSLLVARESAQQRFDSGVPLDFPSETAHIRAEPSWHCVPPAPGLEDRRVEITGPTDRKMVINALNSGAKTFMADFEGACLAGCWSCCHAHYVRDFVDASSPTFKAMIEGQVNLRDAIRRQIDFESNGKQYKLSPNPAVLIVRSVYAHCISSRAADELYPGQEDGTLTSLVSLWTTRRSLALFSILPSTFTTTRRSSSSAAPGPIFTSPRWNTTSKRVFGMMSSSSHNPTSACPTTPSVGLS